jgi:hypothetical protein
MGNHELEKINNRIIECPGRKHFENINKSGIQYRVLKDNYNDLVTAMNEQGNEFLLPSAEAKQRQTLFNYMASSTSFVDHLKKIMDVECPKDGECSESKTRTRLDELHEDDLFMFMKELRNIYMHDDIMVIYTWPNSDNGNIAYYLGKQRLLEHVRGKNWSEKAKKYLNAQPTDMIPLMPLTKVFMCQMTDLSDRIIEDVRKHHNDGIIEYLKLSERGSRIDKDPQKYVERWENGDVNFCPIMYGDVVKQKFGNVSVEARLSYSTVTKLD